MTMYFDKDKQLICDCNTEEGPDSFYDEHHVRIEPDGTIVIHCWNCPSEIRLGGAYINSKVAPKVDNPKEDNLDKSITQEQVDYWCGIALKDLTEDNSEGSWNVYRWLKENNADKAALKLRNAISAYRKGSR